MEPPGVSIGGDTIVGLCWLGKKFGESFFTSFGYRYLEQLGSRSLQVYCPNYAWNDEDFALASIWNHFLKGSLVGMDEGLRLGLTPSWKRQSFVQKDWVPNQMPKQCLVVSNAPHLTWQ